LAKKNKQTEKM